MFGTAANDTHPALTDREMVVNLASENAKLRTQLADATESMGRVEERCAKLRELASILRYCMQVNADCDGCKLNGAKGEFVHDPLLACDGLHDRMRELGVDA